MTKLLSRIGARKARLRIAGVAAAVVVGAAASAVVASPAFANVYNCSTGTAYDNYGWGYCANGIGSWYVLVDCANVHGVVTIKGNTVTRTRSTGNFPNSVVNCGSAWPTNVRNYILV